MSWFTAHFRGNYPPQISVEAVGAEGYPGPEQLAELAWQTLVPQVKADGDAANYYPVADQRRWTHVRLSIYPDGGVARFRVHGRVVPDPRFLAGTVDLAAMENGGELAGAGHDYAIFRLATPGLLRHVEIDTSYFVGNAPGWIRLYAADEQVAGPPERWADPAADESPWWEVLPRLAVQPDTRHRLLAGSSRPATHIRLDVIPDGGLARLRIHGEVAPEGLARAWQRWRDALPEEQRRGLPPESR